MSLPSLVLPIHTIELPISKRKIQIKPFLIKEEGSFLTAINTDNNDDLLKIFTILVDTCVLTEGFKKEDICINDFFFLIMNIRMKSTGELIDGTVQCKHCGKQTDFSANIEDAMKIINIDAGEQMVKISDLISMKLKTPSIDSLTASDKGSLSTLYIVAHSIDTVIFDEKIYNEFTVDELIEKILGNMTKQDFVKISDGMEKMPRLVIEFNFMCMNCGKENEYKTDDISKMV